MGYLGSVRGHAIDSNSNYFCSSYNAHHSNPENYANQPSQSGNNNNIQRISHGVLNRAEEGAFHLRHDPGQ